MNEKTISRTVNLLGILLLVVLITQLVISFTLLERLKTIEQGLIELKAETSDSPKEENANTQPDAPDEESGSMTINELKAKLDALNKQNERDLSTFAKLPGFKEEIERLQNLYDNSDTTTQPASSTQPSELSTTEQAILDLKAKLKEMETQNAQDEEKLKNMPGYDEVLGNQ